MIHRQQLLDGVHAHTVEHVTRLDAVAQLGDRAAAVETARDGFDTVFGDDATVQRLERAPPVTQHVLGIAKSLFRAPTQRFLEKVPQAFAQRRIKTICGNADLIVSDQRISVAPGRWNTRDELMEGDSRCISFRMQVPPALWALREERIEIRSRPRLNVFGAVRVSEKSNRTRRRRPLPPAGAIPILSGLISRWATPCSSR